MISELPFLTFQNRSLRKASRTLACAAPSVWGAHTLPLCLAHRSPMVGCFWGGEEVYFPPFSPISCSPHFPLIQVVDELGESLIAVDVCAVWQP